MRPSLRRGWLVAHRWLGLSLGLLLLLAGATGTLLVVAKPLDEALHPQLFRASSGPPTSLASVVVTLRTEFGPDAALTLRNLHRAGESLHVVVSGPWSGTVYFDPVTGKELGRRGAGEGFFNALFELHSSLYAGDAGRAALAAAAMGFVLMLASGVVLWWPARWGQALRVRKAGNFTGLLFDLHRVSGVCFGLLVLLAVSSGAYMAWKPLASWVTRLNGAPAARPPVIARSLPPREQLLDAAFVRALARWPGAEPGAVLIPGQGRGPWRVRVRLRDDPHPVGMSSVWIDPANGELAAAQRWTELDPGNRGYAFIYPLHVGRLGGKAMLLLTLAGGVALTGYGSTGLWLWWRRRVPHRPRRRRTARPA